MCSHRNARGLANGICSRRSYPPPQRLEHLRAFLLIAAADNSMTNSRQLACPWCKSDHGHCLRRDASPRASVCGCHRGSSSHLARSTSALLCHHPTEGSQDKHLPLALKAVLRTAFNCCCSLLSGHQKACSSDRLASPSGIWPCHFNRTCGATTRRAQTTELHGAATPQRSTAVSGILRIGIGQVTRHYHQI